MDFSKLNSAISNDFYPLPNIEDFIDRISGAVCFSTLDLKSAYWQVEISDQHREKIAFSIGPGYEIYEFQTMPFVIFNAPATCQ